MSVAHMAMVFAAEGLDGPEKLLLLAYTNYCDPHGYCWPSEERLADDCGTSRSTVQRTKRKLVKQNLLKSVRRTNRQGEPISNLSRINLPLLASMARKRDRYDDDLINAITFDDDTQGDPETTLKGTPDAPETASDLLTRQSDSYPESNRLLPRVNLTPTPSQSDAQSLIDPSRNPLSPHGRVRVGDPAAVAPAVTERENPATPKDKPATRLPGQRAEEAPAGDEREQQLDQVAAAYATAYGVTPPRTQAARIRQQAAELLTAGWPVEHIARLAAQLPAKGYTDLAQHAAHNPPTTAAQRQKRTGGKGPISPCPKHRDVDAARCEICNTTPDPVPPAPRPTQGAEPGGDPQRVDPSQWLASMRAMRLSKTP